MTVLRISLLFLTHLSSPVAAGQELPVFFSAFRVLYFAYLNSNDLMFILYFRKLERLSETAKRRPCIAREVPAADRIRMSDLPFSGTTYHLRTMPTAVLTQLETVRLLHLHTFRNLQSDIQNLSTGYSPDGNPPICEVFPTIRERHSQSYGNDVPNAWESYSRTAGNLHSAVVPATLP